MGMEMADSNFDGNSPAHIEEFLGKIEVFRNLPRQSIQLIDKRIRKMGFSKSEKIMSEFEMAKGVFFVHSGIVKLTKQDEHGNELIVCIKKKGDIFAEACLFNNGETYPATGTMVKEGEVYFLNTADLEQELLLSPELAVQMIRYMSDSLRDMTMKTLERLAERFGANRCNQMFIELPLTVQEFSTLVGTSRESVSRVFSKLKKDGLIEIKEKHIIILDWCRFCGVTHKIV